MRALCLLLALGACVLSPERVGFDRLAVGDARAGGVFTPGGWSLSVAAGLREIDGRLAVCGAWTGDGFHARQFAHTVLGAGSVFVGGRRVQNNLVFLSEVRDVPLAPGTSAACAATGEPWQAAVAAAPVVIRLPRIVVESDCDGFGSCDVTRFRQVPLARGPAAPR